MVVVDGMASVVVTALVVGTVLVVAVGMALVVEETT